MIVESVSSTIHVYCTVDEMLDISRGSATLKTSHLFRKTRRSQIFNKKVCLLFASSTRPLPTSIWRGDLSVVFCFVQECFAFRATLLVSVEI